jgi:transglutaminase-like putative cysteine protease
MPKHLIALVLLMCCAQEASAGYKPTTSSSLYQVTYEVNADGSYTATTESMTRVDSQQGIDRTGQDSIYYIDSLERVQVIDAYTLLPDGKKVQVSPESIRTMEGPAASNAPMFSDTKVKVIIYPQVDVGTEVYYKVRSFHHTPVFPGHFYARAIISPHEIYKRVVINLVHSSAIDVLVDSDRFSGGRVESLPSDPTGTIRYKFEFSQTEAFPTETSELAYEDFAPHLILTTMKDYQALGAAYYSRAKLATVPTPEITELAKRLVDGASNEREKVKRIFRWVQQNIRYVAIYAGDGGFVPHSAQSVLENRYGDCKDHTVILESMLRTVGIESTPVLINSGRSYRLPKLAIPYAFDHVITFVPSLDLYLDSTYEFAKVGLLPGSNMNKDVLQVATGKISRTPKKMPGVDYTRTLVKLQLNDDGSMTGTSHTKQYGTFEIGGRATAHSRVHSDPDAIANALLDRYKETGTGRITTPEALELDNDWEQSAKFTLDPLVNLPGPSAFSIPVGIARGDLHSWASMVIPSIRRYPTTCASTRHIEEYQIQFPKKVRVTSVPKDVTYNRSSIAYASTYVLKGRQLTVKREMVDEQNSSVCAADDDDVWREFGPVLRRDLRSQVMIR